ncbi:Peroxidase 50 [Platanthera guangdongensis]|uniref:Peroxidase n=1 Tax=Platanthera guangdongensis TaxID=2320717 RepID=A0ABR2MBG5_9ASPA
MANSHGIVLLFLGLSSFSFLLPPAAAQLRRNYYADVCPNVEQLVRAAVTAKFKETFVTIPGTLRLFAHDCFVEGCDGSILITSTSENKAERDHPDNLSIAGDGFDTVVRAKAAVDAVARCNNKVSCADILVMATRDVVQLAGGPSYEVELGRLDGLSSTAASVDGKVPKGSSKLDELNSIFGDLGLSQEEMIALSGAHTVGFSHCDNFANRIRNFNNNTPVDPTMNQTYAAQLQTMCPTNVDPAMVVAFDPVTQMQFDNQYYINLQKGMGLLTSDQILYTDVRSRPTVDSYAANPQLSAQRFVLAMTRMGRVGVKTNPAQGNIRHDCSVFN